HGLFHVLPGAPLLGTAHGSAELPQRQEECEAHQPRQRAGCEATAAHVHLHQNPVRTTDGKAFRVDRLPTDDPHNTGGPPRAALSPGRTFPPSAAAPPPREAVIPNRPVPSPVAPADCFSAPAARTTAGGPPVDSILEPNPTTNRFRFSSMGG